MSPVAANCHKKMDLKLQTARNSSNGKVMRIFILVTSFVLIMIFLQFVNTNMRGFKTNIREVRRYSVRTRGFNAHIGRGRRYITHKRGFKTGNDLKKVARPPNGKCNGCFKWQFPILIKPKKGLCTTSQGGNVSKIDLLLFIASKHSNLGHRQLMRKVYNTRQVGRHRHKVVFIFGADPEKNRTSEKLLKEESNTYGDVLQMNLNGTYRNSTPIVYNSIQWALDNCLNAKFIGKLSDDTIMNLHGIFRLLDTKGESELQDNVFGACWSIGGGPPIRDKSHKWFTDTNLYPYALYPPFCSGSSYFMSIQTARELMTEVGNIAFPPRNDDITIGINAQLTGHCICNVPGFINPFEMDVFEKGYAKKNCKNVSTFKNFFGIHLHGRTPPSMEQIWGCHSYFKVNRSMLDSLQCKRRFTCRNSNYPYH